MLIARNPVSAVLSSPLRCVSSFLSSRDSVFHCAARHRTNPILRILASSATDRIAIGRLLPMSIYLFALPSARRKSTETRRRAAPTTPTSPSIPVPTFPIRVTARFATKPSSLDATNATELAVDFVDEFVVRGTRDNGYNRRAVIEYTR